MSQVGVRDGLVSNEHGVIVEEIDENALGRVLILHDPHLAEKSGGALAKTVAELRRPGVEDIISIAPNMDYLRTGSYLVLTRYHGVES